MHASLHSVLVHAPKKSGQKSDANEIGSYLHCAFPTLLVTRIAVLICTHKSGQLRTATNIHSLPRVNPVHEQGSCDRRHDAYPSKQHPHCTPTTFDLQSKER